MVKHPSEMDLALFAGGELRRWRRWRVERHLAGCDECRRDVSDFSALRTESATLAGLPEVPWDRLAAEMRANIRLGLEAGECVNPHLAPRLIFSPRALAAYASLAALLVASVFLERPAPRSDEIKTAGPVLETNRSGIQFREGDQGIMLLNRRAHNVNDLATGSAMRESYVDSETGLVTVNNVYVE
jgi:Putative zinc-finger